MGSSFSQKPKSNQSGVVPLRKNTSAPGTSQSSLQLQSALGNQAVVRAANLGLSGSVPAVVQREDRATTRTYTKVKTGRLNPDGVFTSQVLEEISTAWTEAAAYREATTAQMIVDALEASNIFVKVAKDLDEYYARKDTPDIWVGHGHTGTKFVPKGTEFQWKEELPVRVDEDTDTIFIDFYRPFIGGSAAEQTTTFVGGIVHEAIHAHNLRVTGTKPAGLPGHLREEKRTRETEIKALEEIIAKTKDLSLKSSLKEEVAKIRQSGLTDRAIAESMPSAGGATYLEAFYISQAVHTFRDRADKARATVKKQNHTGFDALAEILDLDETSMVVYSMNAALMVQWNQPPIRSSAAAKLVTLLNADRNLKQLTGTSPSGLNSAERLMLHHILLLKAYRIKLDVKREWDEFENTPAGGQDRDVFLQRIARDYLGQPNAYSRLR